MDSKVTIVMRTKDRPLLLKRALASVAAQTFTDYRLIVVNNGGDAGAVEALIKELPTATQGRIQLVHADKTYSREGAILAGLEAHHGEYFAIHDDDDTWAPGFLEATVTYLDTHPEEIGVAVRCAMVREEIKGESINTLEQGEIALDKSSFSLLATAVENYCPPISQLLRRDAADRIGHWDGSLDVQADWDFNIRMLANAPMGFIPSPTLAYWHHREAAGDATDNSVVSEAANHRSVNGMIREKYLRQDFQKNSPYPGLGILLALGYYQRDLLEENQKLSEAQEKMRVEIAELRYRVEQIHAESAQSAYQLAQRVEHLVIMQESSLWQRLRRKLRRKES